MMAATAKLIAVARNVVSLLVGGEYDRLATLTGGVRLPAQELRAAIEGYGHPLAFPPEHAYDDLEVVAIEGRSPPECSVWCPLWTESEGRSYLQLRLRVIDLDGDARVEVDDIRVP